jgi:hypothetical protein
VLAAGLERWQDGAADDERRTVVVRLSPSADPHQVAARLREASASVQTIGRASVVCVVTPATLRDIAGEPWVTAIEEPRRLFPRTG